MNLCVAFSFVYLVFFLDSGIQLLNRRPPFGHEVLAFVNDLPLYQITVEEESIETFSGEKPIKVELTITCQLENKLRAKSKMNKSRVQSFGMTSILTTTSGLDFVDFRRISYALFTFLL